ncbi:MAG: ATP-binding cassette domain-containing protein [Acidimicrobiia bacterium]|nr:ATP-binding cassette domain-containing protein [Acidimicrobiia bacterium]
MALLEIENLTKDFDAPTSYFGSGPKRGQPGALIRAVDNVSLEISSGETLGVVGESGCGKSTLGRMILRLIDPTSGVIRFNGQEIQNLQGRALRNIRQRIQIVFQDPFSSLDPRMRVQEILAEPLIVQGQKRNAAKRISELLTMVGLDPAFGARYPHEFSGGQRQRIGIARALALNPDLVVLDEPVSALDVSIQAQVLNLLSELQNNLGVAFLFIAHDLAVVHHISDRIAVMYLGRVIETGTANQIYSDPQHPYTKALLSAVPDPNPQKERKRERIVLSGDLPSSSAPPSGCTFRTRCWLAEDICTAQIPLLVMNPNGRQVACHLVNARSSSD